MVDIESNKNQRMDMPEEIRSFRIEESASRSRTISMIFFKFVRPCLAELVATMLFVYVDVCCSVNFIGTGFTHAFILFVLVAATAGVSGGHLNPVITLALTVCRGLDVVLAPLYIISQLVGAIIGAGLARASMNKFSYDVVNGGVPMLGHHVDDGQAILAETMATTILVLTVLMVAFDKRNKSVLAPLAIGLAVGGGIFAVGYISGGSMNPARSFGPAIVRNHWDNHYIYWVGPILGSSIATLLYGLVFAESDKLWLPFYDPIAPIN